MSTTETALVPAPGELKGPALTADQRKVRKLNNQVNLIKVAIGVNKIFDARDELVAKLADETGKSKANILVRLGVQTTVKKTRGANSYNAWASFEMAKANAGEFQSKL